MTGAESRKVELGAVTTLPSTLDAIAYGKAAEAAGFDRVAVSDTAPLLYHACYPALTGILLQTERIKAGPYVTNPVSRHWSVHGATARAFEEIAPGRFFLAIGTGDGAVHSVGLKPATLAEFRTYMADLGGMLPASVPVHMTFSGPSGVALAGELATELTIGAGLDVGALRDLAGRARRARQAAGVTAPLKIWVPAPAYFADDSSDIPELEALASGMAMLAARFAFASTFEGKNVPADYQPVIRETMKRYDFGYHARAGGNPNGGLFDDHPEVKDYLLRRFALIGTPEECASRLETVVREAGLDGLWLMPTTLSHTNRPISHKLEIAVRAFAPLRNICSPVVGSMPLVD